jgi:gliding motility-associated-like protein
MAGLYSVTVTDGNNCSSQASTQVYVNASPILDAGNNASIPYGTNTILNATVSGGSGNYSYQWSPSGSLVNSNVSNPQTTNLTATTIFTVTVTDINTGCTSVDDVTINITGGPLSLNIEASSTEICAGESVQLNADITGGTGSYQYQWTSVPVGFTSTLQNPSVSPLTTTTYYVTVSDGFNSTNSSILITVHPLPVATASNTGPYCADGITSVSLSASGGSQYLWSGPCGFSSSEQNPLPAVATVCMNGIYSVTVTSAFGCTAVATTLADVFAPPSVTASTLPQYCNGDTIILNAEGGSTYAWNGPGGFTSTEQNPVIFPADTLNSGTYTVTVTGSNGCASTENITIFYPSSITVAGTITTDDATHMGMIDISITGGTSPYTYLWSNGANTEDIQSLFSGNYVVTVTTADQCAATATFTVDIPLIIPNVITPNNDGKNDDFEILNIGAYQQVRIDIYNRWGDLIFRFTGTGADYYQPEKRWNGKENGKNLPMGSYLYIITLDDLEPVTGSVLVKY